MSDNKNYACPFCQNTGDCEHLLADVAETEGIINGGEFYSRRDELAEKLAKIAKNNKRLILPWGEVFSFNELKKTIKEIKVKNIIYFEMDSMVRTRTVIEILEMLPSVDCAKYEVDEASGTWSYIKYWTINPQQAVNQLLTSLDEASISDRDEQVLKAWNEIQESENVIEKLSKEILKEIVINFDFSLLPAKSQAVLLVRLATESIQFPQIVTQLKVENVAAIADEIRRTNAIHIKAVGRYLASYLKDANKSVYMHVGGHVAASPVRVKAIAGANQLNDLLKVADGEIS